MLLPNPSASGFTGGGFRNVLSALASEFDVHPEWADGAADVTLLARKAAEGGADVVIAMGGDGVVHLVANGLVGTDTPLGIIPAGTTNVVAKILGIPHSPTKAAELLPTYRPEAHTVARVRADTDAGPIERHAVFAAGIGFDADVVVVAEQRPYSKLSFGSLHYARSTISQVFGRYRSQEPYLRVTDGDATADAVAVMVQVHHVYTYFGRVPLHVSARTGPGLAAAAVGRITPRSATDLARRAIVKRSLAGAPGVTAFDDFDTLTITTEDAAPFQADGEPLGVGSRFEIRPVNAALQILSPA